MVKADRHRRVLLKISGEIFRSENVILDSERIGKIALQLKEVSQSDIQIAIVVGGGNILRGAQHSAYNSDDRYRADYMGMLATVINSLALKNALEGINVDSEVLTSIPMQQVAELFTRYRALEYLKEGKIIILAGGTGNPFFTTDTAAALRAAQIDAEAVLKGTKVDGVYDSDPVVSKDAEMIASLSYTDILERELKVMDSTAVALCRENKIAITVFNILKNGNLKRVLEGKTIGTIVK